MESYSNKPFTIEDIVEAFNENEDSVNQNITGTIYKGVTRYSANAWFRKLFPDNRALDPWGYREFSSSKPEEFFHYYLDWGKKDHDATYWEADHMGILQVLTLFFGFFRDDKTGNLVQINPAALFLLHFNDTIPFEKILQPKYTRIIHLGKDEDEFFWRRFRYYMFALADFDNFGRGLKKYNGVRKKTGFTDEEAFYGADRFYEVIPHKEWEQHFYFNSRKRQVKNIDYLRERTISPAAAIEELLPLGTVPLIGYDPKLDCTQCNKNGDRIPTFKEVSDFYKEKEGIKVFRGGIYYKAIRKGGELPADRLQLSKEQQMFHKYCQTYVKKKGWAVPLNTFKEEMVSFGVYPESIVKKKNFMKDIVTRDAKAMGYTISLSRPYDVSDTGERIRVSMVVIQKESYGRTKK